MLNFLTIDLESITSPMPRSSFSEAQLEMFADAIIAAGGVASPILLKKTGFEKYEVLDRHFEYYSAVRASEKEPIKPELTEVNALIVSETDEPAVEVQLQATQQTREPARRVSIENSSSLDLRLTNVELRFEKLINDLRAEESQKQQKLEARLKNLESQIVPSKNPTNPLNELNNLGEAELSVKLERSRISKAAKIAAAIVIARKKKPEQKFEDYRDVIKSVNSLGDKRMLTIIDDWSHQ
jgi:hypothetical protein